jgi:hypothetical protein
MRTIGAQELRRFGCEVAGQAGECAYYEVVMADGALVATAAATSESRLFVLCSGIGNSREAASRALSSVCASLVRPISPPAP